MRTQGLTRAQTARGAALVLAVAVGASVPIAIADADDSLRGGNASSKSTASTAKVLKKKAHWSSNVAVGFGNGYFRFHSNGVPKQGVASEYAVPNPGVVVPNETNSHVAPSSDVVNRQAYDFKITTKPKKANKVTSISTGPVGVMISGALVFNPYEGDGTTVAMASNFTLPDAQGHQVAFLDSCNGHPSPGPVYAYHYHGLPPCVTKRVDKKHGPSHILGVAFDGFPIYGDRDIHGRKIKAAQLDRCNGITSKTPEFRQGIYHYVLLNAPTKHSSMACLKGHVSSPDGAFPEASTRGRSVFLCGGPAEADQPSRRH